MNSEKRESVSKVVKSSEKTLDIPYELGSGWNYSWARDPKSILFMLARYKFASKLVRPGDELLEVGCGEGLGSAMLAASSKSYVGVEHDPDIFDGLNRLKNQRRDFINHDILSGPIVGRKFDAAVSLDVIEHIFPEFQDVFVKNIVGSLNQSGSLVIIGSPSLESQVYASEVSRAGHVGCRSAADLERLVAPYSLRTFSFSMNDEVVHTGFSKMSHYNFVVAVM